MAVADELSKLADLLDRGAITKAEYADQKAELLRGERPRGRSRRRPWESDELLAVLRLAATHQEPLTAQRYSDLRTLGLLNGPTTSIFIKVFGSWSAACATAGIRSGKKLHSNYSRKWNDEELLDFVIEYVSETRSVTPEKSLTAKGMERWLRSIRV
ncbi:MAG: SHOCT domain-containing protein, partial [Acidimicrobiales bacterium]|nr:SHOCT domain-containing protein [Acidimicrobiales bacterium]